VDFFKKEINFQSSMAYSSEDFRDTVTMLALGRQPHSHPFGEKAYSPSFKTGKYRPLADMVTARVLLEDVVTHGFEELLSSTDNHLKILVTSKRSNLVRKI
jgi:hypothetical protein